LFYDKGVETVLFRNQLINQRQSEILNLHNHARKVVGKNINIEDSLSLLKEVLAADICPARFDIGRLTSEWLEEGSRFNSKAEFVQNKLADFIGPQNHQSQKPKCVVLYGFGRIGRHVARELIAQEGRGEQ